MNDIDAVNPGRVKLAETTSAIGAGVLGASIALLLGEVLRPYTSLILGLGLVMHAGGMYDKHRLEARAQAPRVWWAELFYGVCWIMLVALIGYVVIRRP
jgi:hypothetical protein